MQKLSLLFIIFLIFSCNRSDRYGEKVIFRYNIPEGISSLDPAFARSLENVSTVNQLFNGLVQMDEELRIKPCIAKSWEILDSNRLYRFTLRDDVFFHASEAFEEARSRRVKAQDFVFSLKRLIDPEILSPGKWVLNEVARDEAGNLRIKALNDSILEIRLQRPFPPFLGILSMQYCSVIPKEAIAFYGEDFRSNPVGTGPFRFKYWSENTKLVLVKNEEYFERDEVGEQLPYLDAIAISFIKDQEVAFLKFLQAELDYLSGLKGSYKDELLDSKGQLRPEYQKKMKLMTSPYLNTEYLGFQLDPSLDIPNQEQLLEVKLRQAINCGFDRKKMLRYLRNGIGEPANAGFIPKGLAGYNPQKVKGYEYNPLRAKELLAEAGFPEGKGLKTIVIHTTAQYLDICEYLQYQLGEIGIPIRIEVNPAATNNELIAQGKVGFFRKSWVADYPDAENYLSLFNSENFSPSGPNYTHFSNPTYDALFEEAMLSENDSLRIDRYERLDSMLMASAPVVPLFYDQVVRFIPNYVEGIGVNAMNLLDLKRAKKTQK